MTNLANCYHSLHRYEDALKLRRETLELFTARFGPDDSDTLMVMHNIAANLRALGRYAEALGLDQEALVRQGPSSAPTTPTRSQACGAWPTTSSGSTAASEAVPILDECLRRAVGKHPSRTSRRSLIVGSVLPEGEERRGVPVEPPSCGRSKRRTERRSLYKAAVYRAVTAAVLRTRITGRPGQTSWPTDEANRAMAWLVKAVAAGFNDKDRLANPKEFDSVRDRADFRKLMAELEAKQH